MDWFYAIKDMGPFAIVGGIVVVALFIMAFKGKGGGNGSSSNSGSSDTAGRSTEG